MSWPEFALLVLVVLNLLVLPYFLLLLVTAVAAISSRRPQRPEGEPGSRFLIVIPAHDEESGIAATVEGCRAADYPGSLFNVVVIGDNCSYWAAAVGAAAGARV